MGNADLNPPVLLRDVLLPGGEPTLTVARNCKGSCNVAYLLASIASLAGRAAVHARAGHTGRSDGSAEVGGAIVHLKKLPRASHAQEDTRASPRGNDAQSFFQIPGAQIFTLPILAGVNALRVIPVTPA